MHILKAQLLNILIKGKYYVIKQNVKLRITDRSLKYCGIEMYQGKERHNFFDVYTRLFHWLEPNDVELEK